MRWFSALSRTVLALSVSITSCAGWRSPPPVQVAADVSNRVEVALIQIETLQGDSAVDPGSVEKRWAPFWGAWYAWTAAHGQWAAAYERKDHALKQFEAAAKTAFCAAHGLIPVSASATIQELEVMAVAFACPAAQDAGVLFDAGSPIDGGK